MKNRELLPFSRNRYYKGKMLTSADFAAEQEYGNNKRRFINQMVHGSGIACGLGVVSLDDLSILVESGMAIDDLGREVVLESSVVKKLSVIPGFDQLETNEASLCIRYQETPSQPVYAVGGQEGGQEYEYNRTEEKSELFLQDSIAAENLFEAETEFLTGGTLFASHDYEVSFHIPANICAGHYVKAVLTVKKTGADRSDLSYEAVMQTPALTAADGSQELKLSLENVVLEQGETLEKEYWLLAQPEALEDTSVMLKAGSVSASIGGSPVPEQQPFTCKISIVEETPEHLAAREAGNISMELQALGAGRDYIVLANISLVRTESAYLIERVEEHSVKKYIPTLKDFWKRQEYSAYFSRNLPFYRKQDGGSEKAPEQGRVLQERTGYGEPRVATGIVEIPLGENARKGDICYSGEIMHGLGKGNVYVEVGYEYLDENEALGRNVKTTIFGDPDLFEPGYAQVSAQTAVKVLNDKGSFVVAVKLLEDVKLLILTYRWVAIRYDSETLADELEQNLNQSIQAVTPTVVLGTKESYYFQVNYNNMKPCSITYELTEQGSGEITPDGIYTAPSREGVYEIRIYCTEKPLVCTYAYAIVKRKGAAGVEAEKGNA